MLPYRVAYLLTQPNPQKGGAEKVSYMLADYFEKNGLSVYFISLHRDDNFNHNKLFFLPIEKTFYNENNISFLKKIIKDERINFLIVTHPESPDMISLALTHLDAEIKIILHYHNSPFGIHYKIHAIEKYQLFFPKLGIFIGLFYNKYKHKINRFYKRIVKCSDCTVMLANAYIKELEFFCGSMCYKKLLSISNPFVAVDLNHNVQKKKQILYVGRLDENQKYLSLLFKVWGKIQKQLPNWNLIIIGDGSSAAQYHSIVKIQNLKNVTFTGFTDPKSYYEESSIFVMTSRFEGFPMSLVEAMQYGCVPVLFNSFAAVEEIVDNNKSGIVVPAFNLDRYCKALLFLANHPEEREKMKNNALNRVKDWSVEKVGEKWLNLFNKLWNKK